VVKRGYTRAEAEGLVDRLFITFTVLPRVPKRTRGRVVQAIDAGDHWNVLIEWELPGVPAKGWYDKFDVQHSMQLVQPLTDQPGL
jgi:hypothetical protein